MKLFLALALTVVSSVAFAWEPFTAPVWVYKNRVTVVVDNKTEFPIECKGTVYGQLANGEVVSAEFHDSSIWQYRWVSTSVRSKDVPFIKGWAEVFCR